MIRRATLAVLAALLVCVPQSLAQDCRVAAERLRAALDDVIADGIRNGDFPGAVLLVGRGDQIVYRKAYGNRAVQPEKVPMTVDTVFDMASVSKVMATATSIMVLVERGQVRLEDRVTKYLPDFGANGKEGVTVEQLLLHTAGFIPDNSIKDYQDGIEKAFERIYALKPIYPPGTQFRYSDVGYIVLGEIVRVVSGRPLDRFAREEIFEPLGMKDTMYLPTEALKARCAPCEQREGRWMIGEVHDPRAYLMGGVAGHAGLFSTADDVARYCRMILNGGELDGRRVLKRETVEMMIKSRCLPDGTNCRGYGWDVDTGYGAARGRIFKRGKTFGHTGFTGTSFWLDPENRSYVILLSNHVHPKDNGRPISAVRREVGTLAAALLLVAPQADRQLSSALPRITGAPQGPVIDRPSRPASGPPANVLCGIDVLKRDGFKILEGRRIGLITNHTGRDREGNRTVELLTQAKNIQVLKLFSPEHGLYGELDEHVSNTIDKKTGLPVYSLYGPKTRRPNDEMLEGLDTLVYDIQDIGARFYTYPATLGNCMEEAAKRNIRVVVLDRPNPITGLTIDGPLADKNRLGFTAYMQMPVVHGMTIGELARMFNAENKINCDLVVVPVEGWTREMWWDETGLLWINPSPNMRNLTQAALYPAVCLLEATNVSVGRGTDQPFEYLGAPWIDGVKLAAALNAANLPGLRFVPIEFTPTSSKHANKKCGGVYIIVTDRNAIEPVRSGLTIAWHLKALFGKAFEIDKVINLLANAETLEALKKTDDPARLPEGWVDDVEGFRKIRAKYLMYK